MNEFDKRQLNNMLNTIQSFNEDKLPLLKLINNLEDLLYILTVQDQAWNDIFLGYWWEIEQIYALALDEEKTSIDDEDRIIVNNAIMNLKTLIEDRLQDLHQE